MMAPSVSVVKDVVVRLACRADGEFKFVSKLLGSLKKPKATACGRLAIHRSSADGGQKAQIKVRLKRMAVDGCSPRRFPSQLGARDGRFQFRAEVRRGVQKRSDRGVAPRARCVRSSTRGPTCLRCGQVREELSFNVCRVCKRPCKKGVRHWRRKKLWRRHKRRWRNIIIIKQGPIRRVLVIVSMLNYCRRRCGDLCRPRNFGRRHVSLEYHAPVRRIRRRQTIGRRVAAFAPIAILWSTNIGGRLAEVRRSAHQRRRHQFLGRQDPRGSQRKQCELILWVVLFGRHDTGRSRTKECVVKRHHSSTQNKPREK
mmetsp:Transcript_2461/g.5981  ORF Transcript_2461/g.5981 Transcript_2461/m.5981 type:complete len:313 (-) Transcript_2461:2053-2991(-)